MNGTVHIVDDDESFRTSMRRLLRAAGHEVKTYGSAGEFLLEPDYGITGCLLLDLRMPGPDGLELQRALKRRGVNLPIIFLSGQADVPASVQAMKAGAVDFLTKPVEPKVLLKAVEEALSEHKAAKAEKAKVGALDNRLHKLTPREREVFDLVVLGHMNKEIASDLGASERTVKAHRAQIMNKMEAQSVAELVRIAEELRHAGMLG